MLRYLTLVWSEANPVAVQTARRLMARARERPGWSAVLITRGLYVACAGARAGSCEPYHLSTGPSEGLPEAGGVVLGKLFERDPGGASRPLPVLLNEWLSRAILASAGRWLIEHCWGRYVAFLPDPAAGSVRVLRDPSAGVPCLMLQYGGVTLFFSTMEEVQPLPLPAFEVSREYLAAAVCLSCQHTHGTGLRGVLQVLGGECVAVHQEGLARSFHWNPVEIATERPIEDPAEATHVLRASVRDAVLAWAGSYEGILLSLSGGLDSSIILACLGDAPLPGPLTCFHHYPQGPDTDERAFARRVASAAGLPLIERARDPHVSLAPLRHLRRTHQPGHPLYALEHSRLDAELARQHQAAAVFTGWGGDQLFFQDLGLWAAADHVRRRGLGPALWRIALDCARMDRLSVWEVLWGTWLQHWAGRSPDIGEQMRQHRTLIRPEVLAQAGGSTAYLHPLLRDVRGIPPGKLRHLQQLTTPWEYDDPLATEGDPEHLAPLYSQPILEACLRIPTDVLTLGGWPRAIARRAFAEDLPPEIINRWHKGGVEGHMYRILRHNIALVRELLLDGALVREGIVDRRKLAQALAGGANRLATGRVELFEYLGIEAWVRAWQETGTAALTADSGEAVEEPTAR